MLIDHGILQSVVSLFYRKETKYFESSLGIVRCLLNTVGIDYPLYCDISVPVSMERMFKRNRQDSGRLDAIRNEETLKDELLLQHRQFVMLCESNATRLINMVENLCDIYQNVYKIIEENNL